MRTKRGFAALVFALILSLSLVSAAPSLEITKTPVQKIVIKELSMPAVYNITITNNGQSDFFLIDTLLDVLVYPRDAFSVAMGETKTVTIRLFPKASEKNRYYGDWSFRYFIRGDNSGIIEDNIAIKILGLKDILDLQVPSSVKADDESMDILLQNNENISMDIIFGIDSTLVGYSTNFTLNPIEKKTITVPLEASMLSREAGTYNLKVNMLVNGEAEVPFTKDLILESNVKITSDVQTQSSTFLEKITFMKRNDGNTPTTVTITSERTMLQSLITSFSAKPDSIRRQGAGYVYSWERKLNPDEEINIEMKTDYSIPWIVLIALILLAYIIRIATMKQILIRKKAYRVKTKSGHFAAKIILMVRNRGKEVSNTKIIENLPPFTELLQDRFGTIKPAEIKKHSVVWDLPFIAAKEEFILSYIVYSKVSVLGSIEVAPAIATYQTGKGIMKESRSNKIIILTEEKKPEETKAELV